MEDRNLDIVHRFLNRKITLDELKDQLSDEDFAYWKSSLSLIDELPKATFNADLEYGLLLKRRKSLKQNPWIFRIAIAATLLIGSSLLVFNFYNSNPELTTISYQSSNPSNTVLLPDSSRIWLNRGATVSYAADQWNKSREIELNGEAYFEVKKGKTFKVKSELGTVTVLGTTFTVSSKNDFFGVACYTGKVAVNHANERVILQAKDYYSSKTKQVTKINASLPDFLNKWILYERMPLTKVIKDIEKRKQVVINLNLDKEYIFSGGYAPDMSTEEILSLISQSLGLRHRMIDINHYEITESTTP